MGDTPRATTASGAGLDDYGPGDIETGRRIMQSPVNGELFVVRKWVEVDDGRAIALEKEPLSEASDGP